GGGGGVSDFLRPQPPPRPPAQGGPRPARRGGAAPGGGLNMARRHPRLALPFTVLAGPDTVRLVAGEDFRYTLTGPGLEGWLPGWRARLDGRVPLDEALAPPPEDRRGPAGQLVERLYGERVLADGTAADAHAPARWRLAPEGGAAWAAGWQPEGADDARPLPALCQDRLDYDEALRCNPRCPEAG